MRSPISYIRKKENDYELRLLGNKLENSKLRINKDYIDKLSLLLHDSYKYKNYPFKRNNINKIEYKYENNGFRLTFKEPLKKNFSDLSAINSQYFDSNNSQNEIKLNEHFNSYSNNDFISENDKSNLLLTPNYNKVFNKSIDNGEEIKNNNENIENHNFFKMSDNIRKILYNNDKDISLIEQKKIYSKFKNKFPYFRNKLNNQLNFPPFNSDIQNSSSNLIERIYPKSPKAKIKLSKRNKNLELDNLLKTVNELRNLRDKVKIDKNILSEQNIIKEIIKETIAETPIKKLKKKIVLSPYELFYYDPKKWKKGWTNKRDMKKEIHFNEINKQIDDIIKEMKNKIITLNQEIFKLEDIRNKMKSQNKLMAVKSKSFRNFQSHFKTNEFVRKVQKKASFKISN